MDPVVLVDGQSVTIEGWAHTTIDHVTDAEFAFQVATGHTLTLDPNYPPPKCDYHIYPNSPVTSVRYWYVTNDGTTEGRLQVIPNTSGAVQAADYVFAGNQTNHNLL